VSRPGELSGPFCPHCGREPGTSLCASCSAEVIHHYDSQTGRHRCVRSRRGAARISRKPVRRPKVGPDRLRGDVAVITCIAGVVLLILGFVGRAAESQDLTLERYERAALAERIAETPARHAQTSAFHVSNPPPLLDRSHSMRTVRQRAHWPQTVRRWNPGQPWVSGWRAPRLQIWGAMACAGCHGQDGTTLAVARALRGDAGYTVVSGCPMLSSLGD
jgi:hypothetical protein